MFVRPHVLLTVDGCFERFLTIWTHERPDLAVRGHMTFETAVSGEEVITDKALERLLSSVGAEVGLQYPTGHKSSQTLHTLEGFLPW